MGKKSRKAGKAARRQAAEVAERREKETVEHVLNNHPQEERNKLSDAIRAIAIDNDDEEALEQYVRESVFWTFGNDGLESALKALRRWPEMRDCWARMRPRFQGSGHVGQVEVQS